MNKQDGLTGSSLKWLAMLSMLIDHATVALVEPLYFYQDNPQIMGLDVWKVYDMGRNLGRWAFPIFCFLLVEGFFHTRNRKRMFRDLCIFGILSEIPFDLLFNHEVLANFSQNVFFTLALGFMGLWVMYKEGLNKYLKVLGLLVLGLAAYYFQADYDLRGYLAILLFGLVHPYKKIYRLPATLAGFYFEGFWGMSACLPIYFYNGKRGDLGLPKYFFYAFYPAHLLILCLLCYFIYGGNSF